jgi:hypothetical protein
MAGTSPAMTPQLVELKFLIRHPEVAAKRPSKDATEVTVNKMDHPERASAPSIMSMVF